MSKLTNARFAQLSARIAERAASWSVDILDEDLNAEAPLYDVSRFTDKIRFYLDRIDELSGRSSASEPQP